MEKSWSFCINYKTIDPVPLTFVTTFFYKREKKSWKMEFIMITKVLDSNAFHRVECIIPSMITNLSLWMNEERWVENRNLISYGSNQFFLIQVTYAACMGHWLFFISFYSFYADDTQKHIDHYVQSILKVSTSSISQGKVGSATQKAQTQQSSHLA
jgi:hypothetical protein